MCWMVSVCYIRSFKLCFGRLVYVVCVGVECVLDFGCYDVLISGCYVGVIFYLVCSVILVFGVLCIAVIVCGLLVLSVCRVLR